MVVLQDPMVSAIGYVDVDRRVHRDSRWIVETASAEPTVIDSVGSQIPALAEDVIGSGVARAFFAAILIERGVVLKHTVVGLIRHVEVAQHVRRDGARTAQVVGAVARVVGCRYCSPPS